MGALLMMLVWLRIDWVGLGWKGVSGVILAIRLLMSIAWGFVLFSVFVMTFVTRPRVNKRTSCSQYF
jgi:uncharacterized membrane protein